MVRTIATAAFLLLVICATGVFGAGTAGAAIAPEGSDALLRGYGLDGGGCNCEEARAELARVRDSIAAAATLDDARALALEQTGMARKALSRAKWVVPFNGAIGEASGKLDAYEVRVQSAESPEEVAAAFGSLVRLASADDLKVVDAHMFEKEGCSYSTGEIIITIIGFILGIIPGFIFLAVFC